MSETDIRFLNDQFKARCVAAAIFFPDRMKEQAQNKYLSRAGISSRVGNVYLKNRSGKTGELSISELIRRNIDYLFDGKKDVFTPGRFNDKDFAVLYTAKEVETAKAERFYHLAQKDKPFAYVVFSIFASGCLIDLRNSISKLGNPLHQSSYDECAEVAREIIKDPQIECDGLISQSARNKGGSCCNFFGVEKIDTGDLLEDEILN